MNIYIDSENINSKMFDNILTRYHDHSILTTKVFADWTEANSKNWVKYCKQGTSKFIEMVQILKKPKKQSIDFGIIVDILNDVLNDKQTNNAIKHIIIISSDMDYIQLVKMLKKHNIHAEVIDPRRETTEFITSEEEDSRKHSSSDIDKLFDNTMSVRKEKKKGKTKSVCFKKPVNMNDRETERYLCLKKSLEQLKKEGIRRISETKLKKALLRLAKTIHERSLFNCENIDFSKYSSLMTLVSNRWELQ